MKGQRGLVLVQDCITVPRGLWRAALGSRSRRRPPRRRTSSPAPFLIADGGGLSVSELSQAQVDR
jgi:hypothetical protein